jgi:hypothetical protein
VSDNLNGFLAFELLGNPENTNAPIMGSTIPAAFLKKRLRVITSSFLCSSIVSLSINY